MDKCFDSYVYSSHNDYTPIGQTDFNPYNRLALVINVIKEVYRLATRQIAELTQIHEGERCKEYRHEN